MDIYNVIFEKDYLEGVKQDSSISLKGAKKLALIFEETYNFIKIEFINESQFFNEFDTFNNISKQFIGENNIINSKLIDENFYSSNQEDILFDKLKNFNVKYKKFKENSQKFPKDFPKDDKIFFELVKFCENSEKIIINLTGKNILRAKKKRYFIFLHMD